MPIASNTPAKNQENEGKVDTNNKQIDSNYNINLGSGQAPDVTQEQLDRAL
jgi:hypothetical protein